MRATVAPHPHQYLMLVFWIQGQEIIISQYLWELDLKLHYHFCYCRVELSCKDRLNSHLDLWSIIGAREVKSLSRVQLFATSWTVAHQAPLSMGFSRQEYWSGLPFPSPGDLHDPGIEPTSPALLADDLTF